MLIAYSIVVWFAALFMILIGISLAKGNYNWLHGKTFDRLNDNEKVYFCQGKFQTCHIFRSWNCNIRIYYGIFKILQFFVLGNRRCSRYINYLCVHYVYS